MATDRQIAYVESLIRKRYETEVATRMISAMPWGNIGTMKAADMITKLLDIPELPTPDLPEPVTRASRHGVNSSRGTCATCGHPVEPGTGFYYGPFYDGTSKWRTHHQEGECSTDPAPPPTKVEEGWYVVGDAIFQIYRTRNDRLAGKVMDEYTGKMTYQAGAVSIAATGRRLSVQDAAAYGHRTGRCLICGRTLTDPESVEAGIGPVCVTRI